MTGISTLATGSLLALAGILGGGLVTMKLIYYGTMFPQSTLPARAAATLADLHLLPQRFHRLDLPAAPINLTRCGE